MSDLKILPVVHTMHWDNIDSGVIDGQRRVFEALSVPLVQHNANRVPHGDWMDDLVRQQPEGALVVFCDIDAFPLSTAAYLRAVMFAQQGGLFGLAQFSNHKATTDLYAGPMFMAFSKALWQELGHPTLKRTKICDAGEALTLAAMEQNKPLELVMPTACLAPKWALKNQGVFGVGTFYGDCEFFHLFESRKPEHETLFSSVAEDVVAGRPLQFDRYLQIMQHGRVKSVSKPWWKRLVGGQG